MLQSRKTARGRGADKFREHFPICPQDWRRNLCALSEVAGIESGRVLTNELLTSAGLGPAVWTWIVPRFVHRLEPHGFDASHLRSGAVTWAVGLRLGFGRDE